MDRYNLVDGVMEKADDGEYALYSEVVAVDKTTADTLLTQIDGLKEQISEWYGE